ncbi:MAG: GNAT family N-acetyltransferase [Phenylobacterium sp.]|jgi:ribosomal protein S18 acetylase RimI-like enzyme|uniref:GNAT family N-acetyltransferase n=1 Tax=Phenylobacterium sp. TaxID=1871053 RepID=UPI002A303D63|nr:GNAT family N-acetyltransferase [Phenylobacterium sp.]MDD3836362.1 GNAT family N-acetyltransferase [Phenylobacterium sp.]MDX9998694.1 GNAT family N-acetyltransferase [Phenylobacterium sp.]
MSAIIRRAAPTDAEALALVGRATFLETYAGQLPAADILVHCARQHAPEVYAGWLADERCRLWLVEAEEGGAPVGYAVISPPDLPVATTPTDVEIKRIYLLHRFQGRGLGAALMRAVLDEARDAGFERAVLGVFGRNEAAIGFYRRQGFQQAGERKFQVGASVFDDLVLARPLGRN